MNKLVFIALGIAAVAADFSSSWSPLASMPNSYYDINFGIDTDVYYTTNFNADNTGPVYGFEFSSYVDVTVEMEFLSWYMHTWTFTLIPFSITPYAQDVEYTRPIAGDGVHVDLIGERNVVLMNFYTTHTENAKVCGASLLDVVLDGDSAMPTCGYSANYETSYADTYWLYNAG